MLQIVIQHSCAGMSSFLRSWDKQECHVGCTASVRKVQQITIHDRCKAQGIAKEQKCCAFRTPISSTFFSTKDSHEKFLHAKEAKLCACKGPIAALYLHFYTLTSKSRRHRTFVYLSDICTDTEFIGHKRGFMNRKHTLLLSAMNLNIQCKPTYTLLIYIFS